MYAVVKTGGKQYRVSAGDKLRVEMLKGEVGSSVTFEEVLALGAGDSVTIGQPLVAGASVAATVVAIGRADKVRIFKHRRRKHYAKTQGHRQWFTEVQIDAILSGGQAVATAAPVASTSGDDLTVIEGVGPKIAELLVQAGLDSFAKVAAATSEQLQAVLDKGGSKFKMAKPETWPEQAALLAKGDREAFDRLAAELKGGVRSAE